MVGRLRHRLRPDRRAAESGQATAARCSDDGRMAESLQKTCVSSQLIFVEFKSCVRVENSKKKCVSSQLIFVEFKSCVRVESPKKKMRKF